MLAIGRACICWLIAMGYLRGDIAVIPRAESVQCVYITGAGNRIGAHWVASAIDGQAVRWVSW